MLCSLSVNAQGVFSHRSIFDRFGDGKIVNIKALITDNEDFWEIEEKGSVSPLRYGKLTSKSIIGDKDNLVEIVNNVFAFGTSEYVENVKTKKKYCLLHIFISTNKYYYSYAMETVILQKLDEVGNATTAEKRMYWRE